MNTTTQFFTTKDEYKAFRKAFAAAQNHECGRRKISIVERQVWRNDKFVHMMVKEKSDGWMNSAHYLFFNLVCDRDFYSGFSPKVKECYLRSGGDPDRGLNGAIQHLGNVVASAQAVLKKTSIKIPSWEQRNKDAFITKHLKNSQGIVDIFLAPFEGIITVEHLSRLQLPPVVGISHLPEDHTVKPVLYKNIIGDGVIDQTEPEPNPNVVLGQPDCPPITEDKRNWIGKAANMLFGGK